MTIQYLSALTGVLTIFFSLFLLYKKRISFDAAAGSGAAAGGGALDADFRLFKVSSRVPALGLFLIGFILIAVPSLKGSPAVRQYTVSGLVEATDRGPLYEVEVVPQYPVLHLSARGELAVPVVRGTDGRFPVIGLSHTRYASEPIDLNDPTKVTIDGEYIRLKKPVVLFNLGGGK